MATTPVIAENAYLIPEELEGMSTQFATTYHLLTRLLDDMPRGERKLLKRLLAW